MFRNRSGQGSAIAASVTSLGAAIAHVAGVIFALHASWAIWNPAAQRPGGLLHDCSNRACYAALTA